MEQPFWISQIIKLIVFFLVSYSGGWLVKHHGIKVGYTRKINHFALFFLPLLVDDLFPYEKSLYSIGIGLLLLITSMSLYCSSFRKRSGILSTSFLSFDRPEDRPYTLTWCTTQIMASSLVIIGLLFGFSAIGRLDLIFFPVLISGIGDGLAEPIGVRFGRHTYVTKAVFGGRSYHRSFEGSACVFLTSVIVVAFFKSSLGQIQFWPALICLPLLMTLTEAKAPHTWDQPFIYLASGAFLLVTHMV
jgi:phytol kinase